jgi:hypothetical protein
MSGGPDRQTIADALSAEAVPPPANNLERLVRLLTLSHVPRFAIVDSSRAQNVGEHCFRTASITLIIVNEFDIRGIPISKSKALELALSHDIDEAISGDLPTPFKRAKGLSCAVFSQEAGIEEYVVKLADLIEAIIFLGRYGIRAERIAGEIRAEAFKLAYQQGEWLMALTRQIINAGCTYE